MLKVIGVGFGRTGTLSLKASLEHLGLGPCHHMLGLLERPDEVGLWEDVASSGRADWARVYAGYRATVDWPGAAYWRELVSTYPDAKVILTVRDPDEWYESAFESIYRSVVVPDDGSNPVFSRLRRASIEIVWDGVFDGRFADRDYAIKVYDEHLRAVQDEVSADRLLVVDVAEGWGPLCDFLDVPVPDEPFPHQNSRAAFSTRVKT